MTSPFGDLTSGCNITTIATSSDPDQIFPHTLTATTVELNGDYMLWSQSFKYLLEYKEKLGIFSMDHQIRRIPSTLID